MNKINVRIFVSYKNNPFINFNNLHFNIIKQEKYSSSAAIFIFQTSFGIVDCTT